MMFSGRLRPSRFGLTLVILAGVLMLAAVACGGGDSDDDAGATPTNDAAATVDNGAATELELVAKDLKFDKDELRAPAGQEITVTLDNDDADMLHNVAFYQSSEGSEAIFVGDIFTGVDTREFTFTTPAEPGTYFFRCDVHPDTMSGDFIVE